MKSIEGINDGDISSEQTEIATSVDPSPTDDERAPQEHPMESHKENLGNETENAMLPQGIKDEIQTTAEQKVCVVHMNLCEDKCYKYINTRYRYHVVLILFITSNTRKNEIWLLMWHC